MRDPHVVSLTYRLQTPENVTFDNPPPLAGVEASFSYRLEDGLLTATMTDHFASEQDARGPVDAFVRAWELHHALKAGKKQFEFVFDKVIVADRDPPGSDDPERLEASAGHFLAIGQDVGFHLVRKQYPEPPLGLALSPDVEIMWYRYQMFTDGKEPLSSMAYFCLSLMEGSTGVTKGAQKAVCRQYAIEQAVRDRLGDLVSEYGDHRQARKFNAAATRRALTPQECGWIAKAVRLLIRRKAEYDANPTGPHHLITMADVV